MFTERLSPGVWGSNKCENVVTLQTIDRRKQRLVRANAGSSSSWFGFTIKTLFENGGNQFKNV